MRNRVYTYLLWLGLLSGTCAMAQDMQRVEERPIIGTSRYVGMAGAMTAVGGDPSAAMVNPAALGVYRRMEVSLSLDVPFQMYNQVGTNSTKTNEGVMIANFAWITTFNTPYSGSVVSHHLMLGFNRINSIRRSYAMTSTDDYSLMDVAAIKSSGLPESALQRDNDNRWGEQEIGWLSVLGYENYLINPLGDKSNSWFTPLLEGERVRNNLEMSESGFVNEYNISWAMNIRHRLMIGAALNIRSLQYSHTVSYVERPEQGGWLCNDASTMLSGVGASLSLGVLYHPVRPWRLGMSVKTPSITTVRLTNYGKMSATMQPSSTEKTSCETPVNSTMVKGFYQPLEFSLGTAFQMARYGLVSLQYDVRTGKYIDTIHRLSIGMEGVVKGRFFLNAGYAYESGFMSAQRVEAYASDRALLENSVRTDTHLHRVRDTHYASAGFRYRGVWGLIGVAYQFGFSRSELYAHELATPADMRTRSHRLVLTLNWHSH